MKFTRCLLFFSILEEIPHFSDFHDFLPSGRPRRRPRPPRPPPAAAASAAAEAEDFPAFSPPGGRRGGARAASNLPLASLLSPQVGYFICMCMYAYVCVCMCMYVYVGVCMCM